MTALTLPPHRTRLAGFLAATALILIGSYAVASPRPSAVPTGRPAPEATSEPLPVAAPADLGSAGSDSWAIGSLAQIDRSISTWSKNLDANERDFISATNLATLYQGRGRVSYDLGDHERALEAVRIALQIEPGHAPARALEATILFTLHDFKAAFDAADALVRDDPDQLGAVATRFDAELELGRVDAARADIERLAEAGGPAVTIRRARLQSVTGDPAAALELARTALDAAEADDLEDTTFYDYAVGEYARLAGDAEAARDAFRIVLEARDDDPAALLGLARIDAFEGRVEEAIVSLRKATAVIPQPESLALLGDLEASIGDPAASARYDTVRFIRRLGEIEASTYDRLLLRFELDHDGSTAAVLDAAQASLDRQPGAAGHDLVAWALYRLGRVDEAAEQIATARALEADDARLRFHEGAIELARGNEATGRALLESALTLGPALDPIERAEAERLLG